MPPLSYEEMVLQWNCEYPSYFVTQTIKPYWHKYNTKEQFKRIVPKFKDILRQIGCNYLAVIELTLQANIHFHFIFTPRNPASLHQSLDLLRRLGFSKVTTTPIVKKDNEMRTKRYMIKDIPTTRRILDKEHIAWSYIAPLYDPIITPEGFIIEESTNSLLDIIASYQDRCNRVASDLMDASPLEEETININLERCKRLLDLNE